VRLPDHDRRMRRRDQGSTPCGPTRGRTLDPCPRRLRKSAPSKPSPPALCSSAASAPRRTGMSSLHARSRTGRLLASCTDPEGLLSRTCAPFRWISCPHRRPAYCGGLCRRHPRPRLRLRRSSRRCRRPRAPSAARTRGLSRWAEHQGLLPVCRNRPARAAAGGGRSTHPYVDVPGGSFCAGTPADVSGRVEPRHLRCRVIGARPE